MSFLTVHHEASGRIFTAFSPRQLVLASEHVVIIAAHTHRAIGYFTPVTVITHATTG